PTDRTRLAWSWPITSSSSTRQISRGPATPSRDLTNVVLCSSRIISMQSSTHSSQITTVGPAISFLTSCWLLPQKEQYSVFLESLPLDFVITTPSPSPADPSETV